MVAGNHRESKNKLISRKQFLAGSGAVIAAVALAACSPKTTTNTTLETISTKNTSSATTGPRRGGRLKIGMSGTASLGWPITIQGQGLGINQCVFDTLLRSDDKGNVYPWLAESYAIADDLTSITLNLRKGVKFHDGSDFNATIAKWNLEQYIAANSVNNWKSVDLLDDYTIRVNFTKWDNTLLSSFADSSFEVYMVSKASYDAKGQQWMVENPVGTGPFKFVSFQQDVGFNVVRNPNWWKTDSNGIQLPYLEAMDYTFVANPGTLRMSLQSNVLDMVSDLQLSDSNLSKEGIVFHTKVISTECVVPDTINPDSPWSNTKFREAVEYGIDKESIAKAFGYGYLQAPYQMPPRDSLAFNPDFTLGRKFDLEKAKQLLSESGLTLPVQTTLICSQPVMQERALAMQESLAKIGVKVKLDFPDVGRWVTYMFGPWPKNSALYTPYPCIDPTFSLGLQFLMSHIGPSWKPTPELTAAVQAAYVTPKVDVAKIRVAADLIISDALLIPVMEAVNCRGDWPYVHADFQKRGGPGMWNTEEAWINK